MKRYGFLLTYDVITIYVIKNKINVIYNLNSNSIKF